MYILYLLLSTVRHSNGNTNDAIVELFVLGWRVQWNVAIEIPSKTTAPRSSSSSSSRNCVVIGQRTTTTIDCNKESYVNIYKSIVKCTKCVYTNVDSIPTDADAFVGSCCLAAASVAVLFKLSLTFYIVRMRITVFGTYIPKSLCNVFWSQIFHNVA